MRLLATLLLASTARAECPTPPPDASCWAAPVALIACWSVVTGAHHYGLTLYPKIGAPLVYTTEGAETELPIPCPTSQPFFFTVRAIAADGTEGLESVETPPTFCLDQSGDFNGDRRITTVDYLLSRKNWSTWFQVWKRQCSVVP